MDKVGSDPFLVLTFSDLEDWAGETIVNRGKKYQRDGCVWNLCRTSDGHLLASVNGSHPYLTTVCFKDGQLISECSCPYEYNCKHAVAVVLEYIAMLKSGQTVPLAPPDDRRLKWLNSNDTYEGDHDLSDVKVNTGTEILPNDLKSRLAKKSKTELVQLLAQAITRNPDLYDNLSIEKKNADSETIEHLIKSIHREIKEVSNKPAWWDPWHDEGELPDYSHIQKGLKKLLDGGHPDEVLRLGDILFERSNEQIGQSNDEGETAVAVEECMEIVIKALAQCSLADADKLEKAVDFELGDDYEICSGLGLFFEQSFPRTAWDELAGRLLVRLNQCEFQPNTDNYHERYNRDRLIDLTLNALHNAGRDDEAIPLCMTEAENTYNYPRVVKLLIKTGRISEAEAWIKKGYNATHVKYFGIARELLELLVKIKTERQAWGELAAIRAGEFFCSPSLHTFVDLMSAAEKAGYESIVRQVIRQFLEEGKFPEKSSKAWPLPEPELPMTSKRAPQKFPNSELLLEIAVHEKKPDEAIHWLEYERSNRQNNRFYYPESLYDKTADYLSTDYPDIAISVWKNITEFHISLTKPSAYQTAGRYLKKIQKLLNKSGRASEWPPLLNLLRSEHKRKYRLMNVLDGLDSRPIIESIKR
ncbi:MAG: SWIM zinc finger family protein [Candidatus Neomarinimicrobiota bacterium]